MGDAEIRKVLVYLEPWVPREKFKVLILLSVKFTFVKP